MQNRLTWSEQSDMPVPKVGDAYALQLEELAVAGTNADLVERLEKQTFERLVKTRLDFAGAIEGEQAAKFLSDLIAALETQVVRNAAGYGAVRWLWYLRRLPGFMFEGARETTAPYDQALAESLTWCLEGTDASREQNSVVFPVNALVFKHVARLVAGTRALSHLHSMYRRVGKGASLQINGAIPIARAESSIEEAIHIYDDRHEVSGELGLAGLGLAKLLNDTSLIADQVEENDVPVFLTGLCDPIWVPVKGPDGHGGFVEQQVLARHPLYSTSLVRVLNPFGARSISAFDYIKRAEPLLMMALVMPMFFQRIPWALCTLVQFGYFFVKKSVARKIFDHWLPLIAEQLLQGVSGVEWSHSFEMWYSRIKAISPSLWPLSEGGVIREMESTLLLDVRAMSGALLKSAELDRQLSDAANLRAGAFERDVQELLNNTKWKPAAELLSIRGRTLKWKAQAVTDIDAIGQLEGRLLLISCKSLIYDRKYDRGDFQVVRNAQLTVDQAVTDWSVKVQHFRNQPVGDNYDFSSFREIVAVVCTPFSVYTRTRESLAFIDGTLRACASAGELYVWASSPAA